MNNENSNHPDEKRSLKDEFDDSATPEDIDDSKVKFLNGKQGLDDQCIVDVGSDVSFTGLGKEELMKYAEDPFWVRTRMILFVLFWVGWVAMLVAAVVIIVVAPKCPARPSLKWYETDVVYQVNVKSFKDSQKDGAGFGDLEGVSSKIEYLQSIGVNAFWLNSFYKSGDNSYDYQDVVDHNLVDESVGTMEAFDSLRKDTKKKGMRMVLDFIPNHTGKKHEWFEKSEKKEKGFVNFYIWANGTGSDKSVTPPNNWVTVYNTPAWTYSDIRKQWYYHSYLPEYPDLNLQDEEVLNNLDGVLKFWLEKGVDGFAVQGIQRLIELNDTAKDELLTGEFTVDQAGNLDLVKRWRAITDSYSDKPGRERVLVTTISELGNNTAEYYKAGIHIVMSEALVNVDLSCDQSCMKDRVMNARKSGVRRGWQVDNENSPRFASVVSEQLQKAWQVFHLLLPGTAFVYYGDEIAMKNGVVDALQTKDPVAELPGQTSRDPFRTPMLWSPGDNAGFCAKNVTPWLPVNQDYMANNVEFNSAHLVGYTILDSFKDLVGLRSKESFQFGKFEMNILNDDILYFTRKAEGFPGYLVAINRGARTAGFKDVADKLTLVYDSSGPDNVGQVFDTSMNPIGFSDGEVYVFEY